jgi:hypothetical protein
MAAQREQLQSTANQDGDAQDFQPVMSHQVKDDDRQTGRGTANLKWSPGNPPDDKTAHDARDESCRNRYTGCNGNPHTKRQGDKEDHNRCEKILLRSRQQTSWTGHCVGCWLFVDDWFHNPYLFPRMCQRTTRSRTGSSGARLAQCWNVSD